MRSVRCDILLRYCPVFNNVCLTEPNVTTPCLAETDCTAFAQCAEETFPCSNSYFTQFLQPLCHLQSSSSLAAWATAAGSCLVDQVKDFFTTNYSSFPSPSQCIQLQRVLLHSQQECFNQSLCGTNVSAVDATAVAEFIGSSGPLRDSNLEQLLGFASSCTDGVDNLLESLRSIGFVHCVAISVREGENATSAIARVQIYLKTIVFSIAKADSQLGITNNDRCPVIPGVERTRREAINMTELPTTVQAAFLSTGIGALSQAVVCQDSSQVNASLLCPICGNGIVDLPDESCDDMNIDGGDGCSSGCEVESGYDCNPSVSPSECFPRICGDGVRVDGEQCDSRGGVGCASNCLILQSFTCIAPFYERSTCFSCGNGMLEVPEDCDNGPSIGIDGCSNNCTVDPLWQCTNTIGHWSLCTHVAVDFNTVRNSTLDPNTIVFGGSPVLLFLVENPALLDASRFGDQVRPRQAHAFLLVANLADTPYFRIGRAFLLSSIFHLD